MAGTGVSGSRQKVPYLDRTGHPGLRQGWLLRVTTQVLGRDRDAALWAEVGSRLDSGCRDRDGCLGVAPQLLELRQGNDRGGAKPIATDLAVWCRNLGFWVATELGELVGVETRCVCSP